MNIDNYSVSRLGFHAKVFARKNFGVRRRPAKLNTFFDNFMQPQVAPGAIHIQPLRGCAF
ncbi:MAG: hypothetical protein DRR16_32370 [Candidatus Parabeggiatoa sp. nov. 3]|nr:MAG: hypothetical protein DRR16_32370 [Gammaproteobacteria bacterium]